MTATRFWMVWRPDGGPPTARHPSETEAYAEANRLALRHPGASFYVLEAVGHVRGEITVTAATLDPVAMLKRAPLAEAADLPPGLDCRPGPIEWPRPARGIGDPPTGATYDRQPPIAGQAGTYDYHGAGPAG